MVENSARLLSAAGALAHELAELPPRCLREDRLSSYEQWGAPIDEALQIELRHAQATLASGESIEGAIRFAQGAGRHGAQAAPCFGAVAMSALCQKRTLTRLTKSMKGGSSSARLSFGWRKSEITLRPIKT